MHPNVEEAVNTLKMAEDEGGDNSGMLFTGGKDSMIMLHLYREHIGHQPNLLIVDTYNQFDEIYDFRNEIREEWDLEYIIKSNKEFLEDVIWNEDDDRDFAWNGFKTEQCCGALKIDVIADFISEGFSHLIVGRREADLDRDLGLTEVKREPLPHDRYYPLANWSDEMIQMYIDREGIPLPELYYEGYEHTDCVSCTELGEEGDDWSGVSNEQKKQLDRLRDMGYM